MSKPDQQDQNNEFISKVEDMKSLSEMVGKVDDRKSSKKTLLESKLENIIAIQHNLTEGAIARLNEKAFVEFNSNMLNECRRHCVFTDETINSKETTCLKNCFNKFYLGLKLLRKVEEQLVTKNSPGYFVYDQESKQILEELFSSIEQRRTEMIKAGVDINKNLNI